MTLTVETPASRTPEREYILAVVLGEFLGLSWSRVPTYRADVRITVAGQAGELRLPDILLSTPDTQWLTEASIPRGPLPEWDTRRLAEGISLVAPVVPIIFGDREQDSQREGEKISLPLDILGSAFFMLSRYEELVAPERDEHNRFPASAALAYQQQFLDRPIIDEYVEVLWAALVRLWPQLRRRDREACTRVSHDVDRPSRYSFGPFRRFVRSVAGDLIKRRNFGGLVRGPIARYGSRGRLHPRDPFNTFDWLMEVSETRGLKSAFYFICGRTRPGRDASYDPEHPAVRHLIRRIHERGHEIGLHPSYDTYRDPRALAEEAKRLRMVCMQEGVEQQEWGGRMHYLRWEMPGTMHGWEQADMDYDSTLGFADRAGFRCGTCHEYRAFDISQRRPMDLRLRPLVAMEGTVLEEKYEGRSIVEGWERLRELKDACRRVDGAFTLLWHNSYIQNRELKKLYVDTLDA